VFSPTQRKTTLGVSHSLHSSQPVRHRMWVERNNVLNRAKVCHNALTPQKRRLWVAVTGWCWRIDRQGTNRTAF
jgi:hypothetical protein